MCKDKAPTLERLMNHTAYGPDCWEWTGYKNRDGYGTLHVWSETRYTHRLTHRIMWELLYGPIPEGVGICHHCDNPSCVRPTHLFAGTQLANMDDAVSKGRQARGAALRDSRTPVKGEGHGMHKLSLSQVAAIREAIRTGPRGTAESLSRTYGVSRGTISLIKLGRNWRNS